MKRIRCEIEAPIRNHGFSPALTATSFRHDHVR
jgi:hypothetical protein